MREESGITYSDITCRYTINYAHWNHYIVTCYQHNTSRNQAIHTEKLNVAEIQDITMSMMYPLNRSRHQKNLHILDNEASSIIKQGVHKNKIKYQLVPLHLHIRNADEHAIQTFKIKKYHVDLCSQPWISFKIVGPLPATRYLNFKTFPQRPFQSKIFSIWSPSWNTWL